MNRNIKIIHVRPEEILHMLRMADSFYISVPIIVGVPEGTEIAKVHFFPERDTFGLFLSHPSFPETPEGCQFPSCEPIEYRLVTQGEPLRADNPWIV